jgi:hypothetical protein
MLHERVALGVHRARIQRIGRAVNAQEARGLEERRRPKAGYLE